MTDRYPPSTPDLGKPHLTVVPEPPPEREWLFMPTARGLGEFSVAMYEITPGKSNHDRESIHVDLPLREMIRLKEALDYALAHHLRQLT